LTVVQEGRLHALDSAALGTTSHGTVVSNGASLLLGYGLQITNESLTLNGPGMDDWGALESGYAGDINTWMGPVHLNTDSTINVLSNNTLVIQGPIDGAGGLTKIGQGTLQFVGSSANTYAGTTRVNAGVLNLAQSIHDSAIPGDLIIGDGSGGADADVVQVAAPHPQIANVSRVTIANSGLLDLSGFSGPLLASGVHESIGSLSGSGHVELGAMRLGSGENGDSTTYAGVITGVGGGLAKFGSGTMTLSGANTYSGSTAIGEGALIVTGTQPSSDVQIATGAVLGGTGTVGAIKSTGGVVSPGTSPGTLSSDGVGLDAGSTLRVELTALGSDQLNAHGVVTLLNPTLSLSAAGLLPFEGQRFVIVNNDGLDAIAGIFAGLPEGALVSVGARQFHITYGGGTGNDVALVATNTAALYPALSVWHTTSNTVVVSWPQSDINWLLHATPTLSGTPVSWTEISPPYQTNGALLYFNESTLSSNRFYRLHYP
jgi:autotransporter-associated beta strand protein